MRLKSMTIKNFKGIGEKAVTINFAPITMLFGPNNAGKSTVIQALHLAREVFCEHQPDFDRVAIYGKGMNLGSFRDYVHGHDIDKVVRIKLDWDEVTIPPSSAALKHLELDNISEIDDLIYDINSMGIEIGIAWNYTLEKAVLKDITFFFNGKEFTTIDITPNRDGESAVATNSVCYVDPFVINIDWCATLQEIIKVHNIPPNANKEKQEGADLYMLDTLTGMIGIVLHFFVSAKDIERFLSHETGESFDFLNFSEEPPHTFAFSIINGLVPQWGQYLDLDFRLNGDSAELDVINPPGVMTLCSNELFTRLISMTGKLAQSFLNNFLYIGPMREIPPRGACKSEKITHERWATGLAAWDVIANANNRQIEYLNKAIEVLGLEYHIEPKEEFITPLSGKIVKGLKQIHREMRDKPQDPMKVLPQIIGGVNEIHASIKSHFDTVSEKQTSMDIAMPIAMSSIRIVLKSTSTGLEVEPQDMGLGVSQIIPFMVAATLAKKDAFVAVEQPELHIHPKLQVNLGDVIIQAALQSENTPIFLIETHSEHLLLRFLRRIRQTNEERAPEGLELKPEQITVNWIGAREKQTCCLQLEIDEDGSFNTPWPEGFFGERGEELFG